MLNNDQGRGCKVQGEAVSTTNQQGVWDVGVQTTRWRALKNALGREQNAKEAVSQGEAGRELKRAQEMP